MLEHHFLDMALMDKQARQAELRATAAREHLAARLSRAPGLAPRTLAALGARLVAAGLALQRMAGAPAASAAARG